MPETLYIGDQIKVIFDWQDFAELVENSLGKDAVSYIERLISAKDEDEERHQRELQDAFDEGVESGVESGSYHSYENGREDGYEEGYGQGYAEGYAKGVKDGCDEMRRFR